MRALLPDAVAVVEDLTGARHSQPLLPQEAAALGAVARKRRLEFTAGRNCARAALSRIGVAPVPVLSGEERDPQWPAGVVGSITHAEGYCAAAVAYRRDVFALGIDAEASAPLGDDVLRVVCTPSEARWLRAVDDDVSPWASVVFSAKEATYKAWFPAARRWLGFEDAEVTVDRHRGSFRVELLVPPPPEFPVRSLGGRFSVIGRLVLTAVVVAAADVDAARGAGDEAR